MIIVFGSINMDVTMRMQIFPRPGETILAPSYDMGPGGKGANQAMACGRSGVRTALVGMVGDDGMGVRILNNLRRHDVMTSGVATSDSLPTGMAFVMTDQYGENQIIVASGANSTVRADQVPNEILVTGNIALFQMELNVEETQSLIERAHARGVSTIVNLAPARKIAKETFSHINYLIVNEHEIRMAAECLGVPSGGDPASLAKDVSTAADLVCIVTLGVNGSIGFERGRGWRVAGLDLGGNAVDTTGAGDCYCGTFAAAIHDKLSLPEAMRRASVAASLSCSKKGAQDSYPYIHEINEALKGLPDAEKF